MSTKPAATRTQRPSLPQRPERAAVRTRVVETKGVFSWSIEGELWTFRAAAQITVGPMNDLEAEEQTITSHLAAEMIRAGKVEAVLVRQLEGDLELMGVDADREDVA